MRSLKEAALAGKRVILREDFNVPMTEAPRVITEHTRIERALPTIRYILEQGATLILLSHWGRPAEGQWDAAFSLQPVADYLRRVLNQEIIFLKDWEKEGWPPLLPGQICLLDNIRFAPGEEANDPALAKKLALLGDVFVMDAFASAHRAHASTQGIVHYIAESYAGFLLEEECSALQRVLSHRTASGLRVGIVGGSKVSTKCAILEHLLDCLDVLIVGGGIANTFLKAEGQDIGASLYEESWVPQAQRLLEHAHKTHKQIIIPQDVVVLRGDQALPLSDLHAMQAADRIMDLGAESRARIHQILQQAQSIIWNGPLGVFEQEAFAHGTVALMEALEQSPAYRVAGGGDTLAALALYAQLKKQAGAAEPRVADYISTGGGAFLEYIEGKALPALVALEGS